MSLSLVKRVYRFDCYAADEDLRCTADCKALLDVLNQAHTVVVTEASTLLRDELMSVCLISSAD